MLHAISATIIRNNMDQNTEPCDDFFQFACGGYFNLTVKPDYTVNPAALTFSDYELKVKMYREYGGIIGEYQQRHFRLAKNLYNSCMNTCKFCTTLLSDVDMKVLSSIAAFVNKLFTARIEADGFAPLQNILNKLGGWPNGEFRDLLDIVETNSKIMNAGYPSYIIPKVGVYIDTYNKIPERVFYVCNNPVYLFQYLLPHKNIL